MNEFFTYFSIAVACGAGFTFGGAIVLAIFSTLLPTDKEKK